MELARYDRSVCILWVDVVGGKEKLICDKQAMLWLRSLPTPHYVIGGFGRYACGLTSFFSDFLHACYPSQCGFADAHDYQGKRTRKQLIAHVRSDQEAGGTIFLLDPSPGFGDPKEDPIMALKFFAAVIKLTNSLLIFNVRGGITNEDIRILSLAHCLAMQRDPLLRPQHLVVVAQDVDALEFTPQELENFEDVLASYVEVSPSDTQELREHKNNLNGLYPRGSTTLLGVSKKRRDKDAGADGEDEAFARLTLSAHDLALRSAFIAITEVRERLESSSDESSWRLDATAFLAFVDAMNGLDTSPFDPLQAQHMLKAWELAEEAVLHFNSAINHEMSREEREWTLDYFIDTHNRQSEESLAAYRSRCQAAGISRIEQDRLEVKLREGFKHAFVLGTSLIEEDDIFVLLAKLRNLIQLMEGVEELNEDNKKLLAGLANQVEDTLRYAAQLALFSQEIIAHAKELHQAGNDLNTACLQQIEALRQLQKRARRGFLSTLAGIVGLVATVFSFGAALPTFCATLSTGAPLAILGEGLKLVSMVDGIVGAVSGKGFLPTPVHQALNVFHGVGALSQGVKLSSLPSVSRFTGGLADVASGIPGGGEVASKLRAIAGLSGGIASLRTPGALEGFSAIPTTIETVGHAATLVGAEDIGQKLLMVGSILANGQMIVETVKGHFEAVSLDEEDKDEVVDEEGEREGRELEESELDIDGRGKTKRNEDRKDGEKESPNKRRDKEEEPQRKRKKIEGGQKDGREQQQHKSPYADDMDWMEAVLNEPFHITLANYEDTVATQANMDGAAVDDVSMGAEAASLALDLIPVVGTVKSLVQLVTGRDIVTGQEVHRGLELLGIIPIGKVVTKVGKKVAPKVVQRLTKTVAKEAGAGKQTSSLISDALKKPDGASARDWGRKMKALDRAQEKGTIRILEGVEYETARKLGNKAAAKLRRDIQARITRMFQADPEKMNRLLERLKTMDIDHLVDIKAGGSPIARSNLKSIDRTTNRSAGSQLPHLLKKMNAK